MTDLALSLVCCSCHQVPASAVESQCCHSLFCWTCGIVKARTPCPVCSQILQPEEFKENIVVNRVLSNLQVRCQFEGCNEMLSVAQRSSHEAACAFAVISCPNSESCGTLTRYDLQHHLLICPNRDVQCHKCESRVRLTDLQNHISHSCPNADIPCPRGCDIIIRRADIEHHQLVCEYEFISCPLAPLCTARFMRGEMQTHVSANISDHLTRVLEHSRAQDQEIFQLRSRVTALENAPRSPSFSMERVNPRVVACLDFALLQLSILAAFCATLPVRSSARWFWKHVMPVITGYFMFFIVSAHAVFWFLPRWHARWMKFFLFVFAVSRLTFRVGRRLRCVRRVPPAIRGAAYVCLSIAAVIFALLLASAF